MSWLTCLTHAIPLSTSRRDPESIKDVPDCTEFNLLCNKQHNIHISFKYGLSCCVVEVTNGAENSGCFVQEIIIWIGPHWYANWIWLQMKCVLKALWESRQLASYQIRKVVGCACAGNAGNLFPATIFKRIRFLAIPACITARASRTCRDACRDR